MGTETEGTTSTGTPTPAGPASAPRVGVVTVTYNSAAEIGHFLDSLVESTPDLQLHVVVVDNSSTDDTLEVVARYPWATAVRAGGNVGYSAGINVGRRHLPDDLDAIAILNPDLTVQPGALGALVAALGSGSGTGPVGVTAPRIIDGAGHTFHSLRREPGVVSQLGEAAFGAKWPSRPPVLGDTLRRPEDYATPRDVDWASGAALVVSTAADRAVGDWREDFFLYSEETDFCRRVRQAGYRVRFVPDAVVQHVGAASGSSPRQTALMNVNKLRDFEGHHGPLESLAFRGVLAAQYAARSYQPGSRETVRRLLDRSSWASLPHAVPDAVEPSAESRGTIVIPAHNEGRVIGRLLDGLQGLSSQVQVVVVSNGSTDDTIQVAEAHLGGLTGVVLDSPVASKQAALNLGDATANRHEFPYPRAYVDADIELTPQAVDDVFAALADPSTLIARPAFDYVTDDADPLVSAFYRARSRTPQLMAHMWGAGFFAVSALGRARWGEFPDAADDLFVDDRFTDAERAVVAVQRPIRVHVPRTTAALARTLRRVYRAADDRAGGPQDRPASAHGSASTLRSLVSANRSHPMDAVAYIGFAIGSRVADRLSSRSGGQKPVWERDSTSR